MSERAHILSKLPPVMATALPVLCPSRLGGTLTVVASRTTFLSGLITGVIILAIMTGTVGIGTAAAVLLNRTSKKKGLAIAVLTVMIACAAVIAFTATPVVYVTVHAWFSREG